MAWRWLGEWLIVCKVFLYMTVCVQLLCVRGCCAAVNVCAAYKYVYGYVRLILYCVFAIEILYTVLYGLVGKR